MAEGKAGTRSLSKVFLRAEWGTPSCTRAGQPQAGFLVPGVVYALRMTREEAETEARRLAADHADRASHRWIARERSEGSWEVVKVKMPPGMRVDPVKATVETKPKPPQPDDPRTPYERNIGGPWGPV